MASQKILSSILRPCIVGNMKGQFRLPMTVIARNSLNIKATIGNTVYRKFSTSLISRSGHHEEREERTQEEITNYVKEELSKNWTGFGFYPHDRFRDTVSGNLAFFLSAVVMIVPVFIYNYYPDYALLNWSQREAYLLLKEREAAGVDPISKDYIAPELVELPSDEELGDIDIKI